MNCWIPGCFNNRKYFDVFTEYAKNDPEDICIRITIHNRGNETGYIALLPTLWLRNLWSFGIEAQIIHHQKRNRIRIGQRRISITHYLANIIFILKNPTAHFLRKMKPIRQDYTGNPIKREFVKDAFHDAVIHSRYDDTG